MVPTQAKAPENHSGHSRFHQRLRRFLRRALAFIAGAFIIAALVHYLAAHMNADEAGRPAGFSQGIAQGALMPLALPNLLAGHDVTIYARHNTGRSYKLGYTVGVNGCGALFFGLFFWRLSRLRRQLASARA